MPARAAPPADQIPLALAFLLARSFIRPEAVVVIGYSAGGWGALALAAQDPKAISAIIAFAPGRGGHANDLENRICAPHALLSAAQTFGRGARVPVTWLVAAKTRIFRRTFPPSWSMPSAPAEVRPILAHCWPLAAKDIGWRRPRMASNSPAPNLMAR